jgi:hypothetical protein
MALYEIRRNADNQLSLPPATAASVLIGSEAVLRGIVEAIRERQAALKRPVTVAFEGWYGVDWQAVAGRLAELAAGSAALALTSFHTCFKSSGELGAYKRRFLTEDPGFGQVNRDGSVNDLLDPGSVGKLRRRLEWVRKGAAREANVVVHGPGAAAAELEGCYDLVFYFDKTRQPLLWEMWDGKLVPFGCETPREDYGWKEYYYCDFYLLQRQKELLLPRIDFWIEAISVDTLKMMPRSAYECICANLVRQPIKEVNVIQPGPWGAYRYRDLFDVPGLGCNAWHELAGPELSLLVDIGREECLNFPFMNLMRHADLLVGPLIAETYPGLFPMDVWLDDGYFPTPAPAERTSMPLHNHPSTDYVRAHFKEPLGRYETYYIVEAYEGANTWHGYREDADLDEWERLCRRSNNLTPIPQWKDYVANWPTNVGDLFLIPPGTTHGHGGNQMVLEMDTCPSIAGTEYSFFLYDFARNTWDDHTKTMSAKPCRMHLEHGFDSEKWIRAGYSARHLQPRPRVVRWTTDCQVDRYASVPAMPFEIERFHFDKWAENDTEGRFLHILTVTVGKRVTIRSKADPARASSILKFQSAVVPACFGPYEMVHEAEGTCTVVQMRWKLG